MPASDVDPLRDGERKQVTILFADLYDSTRLIAGLDPEKAIRQIDPALQLMIAAVEKHGGVVNRVEGDGVMALFGVPTAWEDHATRACLAADGMVRAVAALDDPNIAIRVGLDSGEVVIYPTGRGASDYEVAGVIAHIARRVEQNATPGTVHLTHRTARLARGYINLAPLGHVALRGLNESPELFRLISASPRSSWEVRCSVEKLNRFVGRETEIAQLVSALGRVRLGRGQIITIMADAGFGKSRLVHEFLHTIPSNTWGVVRVAAVSQNTEVPYSLAAELLRSFLSVEADDNQAEVIRKLKQTLAVIDSEAKIDLAPLQSLLDMPVDEKAWAGLAPSIRRSRTMAALRSLVLREAALRPLVLLVDDYHWVDPASADVLEAIIDGAGAAKLLMVVTARPQKRPRWTGRSYCLELQLPALEPENAETLLRGLIGTAADLDRVRQQILVQAGGVPLFIEEIAHSLNELRTLPFELNIPASVQAIIAERIDRLPPPRRKLLQIAAVVGKDVPLKLLQAVSDLPHGELECELRELQDAEFLYELDLPSGTEFTFRHALIQTVAYEEILRVHRRDLHARTLEAMEALFTQRRDELTERFADHALRGEVWEAAASYNLKAGDRAIARWAWREAIVFFERAIEALTHLPDSPDKVPRSIEARLRLRVALPAAAELPRWAQCMDEARVLATSIGDELKLAEIDTGKCIGLTKMGLLDPAIEAGQQAHAAAEKFGVPGTFLNASFALAQAYWYRGNFALSERLLTTCLGDVLGKLRLVNTGTTGTASVLHLVCLTKTYAMCGKFADAEAAATQARRTADEIGKPFDIIYSRVGKGFCLLLQDQPLDAVQELEEALRLARAGDIALLIPSSMRYLGRAYALTGRLEDARELMNEAVERTTAQGLLGMRLWS